MMQPQDDTDEELTSPPSTTYDTTVLAINADMTIDEIYQTLLLEEEVILEVDEGVADDIRKSLTAYKAKENLKLKAKGMPIDKNKLDYNTLKSATIGNIRLHITLQKPKTFSIKKIEKPSDF